MIAKDRSVVKTHRSRGAGISDTPLPGGFGVDPEKSFLLQSGSLQKKKIDPVRRKGRSLL
jgi:hypothetical protein